MGKIRHDFPRRKSVSTSQRFSNDSVPILEPRKDHCRFGVPERSGCCVQKLRRGRSRKSSTPEKSESHNSGFLLDVGSSGFFRNSVHIETGIERVFIARHFSHVRHVPFILHTQLQNNTSGQNQRTEEFGKVFVAPKLSKKSMLYVQRSPVEKEKFMHHPHGNVSVCTSEKRKAKLGTKTTLLDT